MLVPAFVASEKARLAALMGQREPLKLENFTAAEARFLKWAVRTVITNIGRDPLSRYFAMDAGIQTAISGSSGGDAIATTDGDVLKAASSVLRQLATAAEYLASLGANSGEGLPEVGTALGGIDVYETLAQRRVCYTLSASAAKTLEELYEGGLRQLCPTCAKAGFKDESCLTMTCCNTKWCYICARVYHEGIAALPGAARMMTTTGPLVTVPHAHACPHLLERGDMADTEVGVLISAARATELFHVARHAAYVYCMMLACGDKAALVPMVLSHDAQWMMWWRKYNTIPFLCDDELWAWRASVVQKAVLPGAPKAFTIFARALVGCESLSWLQQYALACAGGVRAV
jgi:hypothetical protein